MPERKTLNVNGRSRTITIDDPEMPLLYALRDNLGLRGPLFGCGLAQCGACTVHVDGRAVRSCVLPLSKLKAGQNVVTLEGLSRGNRLHPVQRAFIEEQAVAMRLLHQRHDHGVGGVPRRQQEPERGRYQEGAGQEHLPLRHPHPHCPRGQARGRRRRKGGRP